MLGKTTNPKKAKARNTSAKAKTLATVLLLLFGAFVCVQVLFVDVVSVEKLDPEKVAAACEITMKQIDEALLKFRKEKPEAERPQMDVLVRGGYLERMPECPGGGRYVLPQDEYGEVICSIREHNHDRAMILR